MTGEADAVNADALSAAGSEAAVEGSLNSKSAPFLSLFSHSSTWTKSALRVARGPDGPLF